MPAMATLVRLALPCLAVAALDELAAIATVVRRPRAQLYGETWPPSPLGQRRKKGSKRAFPPLFPRWHERKEKISHVLLQVGSGGIWAVNSVRLAFGNTPSEAKNQKTPWILPQFTWNRYDLLPNRPQINTPQLLLALSTPLLWLCPSPGHHFLLIHTPPACCIWSLMTLSLLGFLLRRNAPSSEGSQPAVALGGGGGTSCGRLRKGSADCLHMLKTGAGPKYSVAQKTMAGNQGVPSSEIPSPVPAPPPPLSSVSGCPNQSLDHLERVIGELRDRGRTKGR